MREWEGGDSGSNGSFWLGNDLFFENCPVKDILLIGESFA